MIRGERVASGEVGTVEMSTSETKEAPQRPAVTELACPQCDADLAGLTVDRCDECGLIGAVERARHAGDISPWVWRRRNGRFRSFVQTVRVVLRLERRHLRRWSRLSLSENRHATRFALVPGLWLCVNATLGVSLLEGGGILDVLGLLLALVVTLPIPLAIAALIVLGQTGLLSGVARRAGRAVRMRPMGYYEQASFRRPEAESENLECSGCGYNLAGLPGDRCPECGLEGAVTLARRGHVVDIEYNIWPIAAYGTACWVPALLTFNLMGTIVFLGREAAIPPLAGPAVYVMLGLAGSALVYSAGMWIVYHSLMVERVVGRPLGLANQAGIVGACVVPPCLGGLLLVSFLQVLRSLGV